MNLNSLTKEELELMSYTDLTNVILKENGKPMNTPSIFKKICELLEYSDSEYTSKIGDYYTSLTLDKRFLLLETEWDLASRHSIKVEIDDDEEESFEEETEENEEEEEIEEEDGIDTMESEIIEDDDLEDLTIVDEDELEEEN